MHKINPINLIKWRACFIDTSIRSWNTFSVDHLSGFVGNLSVVDTQFLVYQLYTALSLLSSIFRKGGTSWFYNVFRRQKRYKINLKTLLYVESSKPFDLKFGLTFPIWFPGKLSNHKFFKLRSLKLKKKLFYHRISAVKKSFRLYRAGGYRFGFIRRRRRFSIPRWAKLDRFWRPRGKSIRKGFSFRRLAFHRKMFRLGYTRYRKKKYARRLRRRRIRRYHDLLVTPPRHLSPFRRRMNKLIVDNFKKIQLSQKKLERRLRRSKKISSTFSRAVHPSIVRFGLTSIRRNFFYSTWGCLSEDFNLFFYKPTIVRSFKIYKTFIAKKPVKFILNEKITRGTPQNPTNLPLTNMPTASVRRKEKKIKKIIKLYAVKYNNRQGSDFSFLLSSPKSLIMSSRLRSIKADKSIYYPTSRFYKRLLRREYRLRVGTVLSHFSEKSYIKFISKYTYSVVRYSLKKKLKFKKKLKIRKYFFRLRKQSKIFSWIEKIFIVATKTIRLSKGLPSLYFRGFMSAVVSFLGLPFDKRNLSFYKVSLSSFYNRFRIRNNLSRLFTFFDIRKPPKSSYVSRFQLIFSRMKRIKRFKKGRPKARLGVAVLNEKLFRTSSNKPFKDLITSRTSFKRLTFTRLFCSSLVSKSSNFKKKIVFNFSDIKTLRQHRRDLSLKYYNFTNNFYRICRSPTAKIFFSKLTKVSGGLVSSNRKVLGSRLGKDKISFRLRKSKTQFPKTSFKVLEFLRCKRLRKLLYMERRKYNFVSSLKRLATPLNFYPSMIFVARLTRLTSCIIGEASATGVICVHLNTGGSDPIYSYYNVTISNKERILSKLEPVVFAVYLVSKLNFLFGRYRNFL